jgi:P27 family predicted phage terminase small subunit
MKFAILGKFETYGRARNALMPGTSKSGGRNRKSNREHDLAGTGRSDRGTVTTSTSADAPDLPKGRPRRPSNLRGHALAEWVRMVDRLELAGTLATVDDAALYQYCCLYAETEGITDKRRTTKALVATLTAAVQRLVAAAADADPEAALVDVTAAIAQIAALEQQDVKRTTQLRLGHMAIRQYLVEFGMTPAARSRVTKPDGPDPTDPMAEFDEPQGPTH